MKARARRLVVARLAARTCAWLAACASFSACASAPAPAPTTPPPFHVEAPAPVPVALAWSSAALANDPGAADRIKADITYLASPELEGRMTGSAGAELAATFIAKRFADLHLAPDGDRQAGGEPGFRQAFEARIGSMSKRASLRAHAGPTTLLATEVEPGVDAADGSSTGEAKGSAVFVGFGISAPAASWDDYAGQDLAGKIAVVLAGTPPQTNAAAKAVRDFGAARYKLRTAREHHAAGVVIVDASDELPKGARADASGMGVPAVVVSRARGAALFPALRLAAKTSWERESPVRPRPLAVGDVALAARVEHVNATAWNVVAKLPARAGSPVAHEIVVVGAHYDHLGHGGSFSLAPGDDRVHPGADDNASGVALLLEVARRLTSQPTGPDRAVVFIAFSGEELGTLGSRYWVTHPPAHPAAPIDHVVAMINADMVGRLRDEKLVVEGMGTSAGWRPLVDRAATGLGLELSFGNEGFGASDHASFTAARVPVTFFFTGAHADYHRPTDTAEKINAEGEARIATLAARLALEVAGTDGQPSERLAFVDAPADPHGGGVVRGGFKVSLGTVPDYGFSGKGVRLDGVRADAPAARAGVTRGDVIVKLATHDITNIHDFMFALGELEPGAETTIEVERDGKRVSLKITPAPGR